MTVVIKCDECNGIIDDDDSLICLGCYETLSDELSEAQARIKELEKELEEKVS